MYLDVIADCDRDLIALAEAVPATALDSLGPGGRWSTQALLAPIPFQVLKPRVSRERVNLRFCWLVPSY